MKIGITYDLRQDYLDLGYSEAETAEFDSALTIAALQEAVETAGHRAARIGRAQSLCERLAAGERWDLVLNIAEGLVGRSREAQVPALLELYQIPYTFSDPLVCALTLDKGLTKRVVRSYGYLTPDFVVVPDESAIAAVDLPYPLFAKPLAEGTGKGISASSFIANREELTAACRALLAAHLEPVLVETYLPGCEFTVGILGNAAQARVLGTLEVIMHAQDERAIYSYETKEHWHNRVIYQEPEAGSLRQAVESLALGCYLALECRDTARVDIRLDANGQPSFMEINPLPGLNPIHSDLPMIAYRAGMTYNELIKGILDAALGRLGMA